MRKRKGFREISRTIAKRPKPRCSSFSSSCASCTAIRRKQGGQHAPPSSFRTGTLFGDGVCARIKEELLKTFNLHTVVRLPNGVFAPYTGIPTNILFFDRSGPTSDVWYYEQPKRPDGSNYSKSKPMQFEEFAECIAWFGKRIENERTWKVSVAELLANGYNLDQRNPRAAKDLQHLPPERLVSSIREKEERILTIMSEIRSRLDDD